MNKLKAFLATTLGQQHTDFHSALDEKTQVFTDEPSFALRNPIFDKPVMTVDKHYFVVRRDGLIVRSGIRPWKEVAMSSTIQELGSLKMAEFDDTPVIIDIEDHRPLWDRAGLHKGAILLTVDGNRVDGTWNISKEHAKDKKIHDFLFLSPDVSQDIGVEYSNTAFMKTLRYKGIKGLTAMFTTGMTDKQNVFCDLELIANMGVLERQKDWDDKQLSKDTSYKLMQDVYCCSRTSIAEKMIPSGTLVTVLEGQHQDDAKVVLHVACGKLRGAWMVLPGNNSEGRPLLKACNPECLHKHKKKAKSPRASTNGRSSKAKSPRPSRNGKHLRPSMSGKSPRASTKSKSPRASMNTKSPRANTKGKSPTSASLKSKSPRASTTGKSPTSASTKSKSPRASKKERSPKKKPRASLSPTSSPRKSKKRKSGSASPKKHSTLNAQPSWPISGQHKSASVSPRKSEKRKSTVSPRASRRSTMGSPNSRALEKYTSDISRSSCRKSKTRKSKSASPRRSKMGKKSPRSSNENSQNTPRTSGKSNIMRCKSMQELERPSIASVAHAQKSKKTKKHTKFLTVPDQ